MEFSHRDKIPGFLAHARTHTHLDFQGGLIQEGGQFVKKKIIFF